MSVPSAGPRGIGGRLLRWSLVGALVAVLLAYATAIAYLMANEVELVFAPNRRTYQLPAATVAAMERVPRTLPDGSPGLLWVLRGGQGDAPWVIFLHGNAANIGTPANVRRYAQLITLGVHVVAPEYPGFGELAGAPSEAAAVAAAHDAWRWLRDRGVPPASIAIYGWSLGSGVATQLAADVNEGALVLEGAFTGVDDRASELYPWLPIRLMVRNRFASRERIASVGSPLLLLHARDDQVIPFAHAEALLRAAREPRRLVPLTGGHIVPNERDARTYESALRTFFAETLGTTRVQSPSPSQ